MNMKKTLAFLCTVLLLLAALPGLAEVGDYPIVTKAETHKVIYDTDNETDWFGDDSFALLLLKAFVRLSHESGTSNYYRYVASIVYTGLSFTTRQVSTP